jgi:glycosyltransferase involved in cell wall biosynthesis
MHVAVVDEELPFPMTSGKRLRTLNLLMRLARRHRITYICHRNADRDEAVQAAEHLEENGIETIVVDRVVPPKSGALFYARLCANLFSPLPYSVTSHRSDALRDAVRAYAASNDVDLWQCEWTPYAEVLSVVPSGRTVIMAHNVESQIWRRYFENEPNLLKRLYIREQLRKYEQFESRVCAKAERVVAVSDEDARLFGREFGVSRVDVVENGVDIALFQPTGERREEGRILFLGSLDWRPNVDAVGLLLDGIFPQVRAEVPRARLSIVGRNPSASLIRRVQQSEGVELVANPPDVRPFLAQAAVMAVPLRIGGGSRLKILEALATELPVVSTTVGAEGLTLEGGRHLVTVDQVDDMAAALVNALRDPDRAEAMAREGRRAVLERYGWDALADKLEQVWVRCRAH